MSNTNIKIKQTVKLDCGFDFKINFRIRHPHNDDENEGLMNFQIAYCTIDKPLSLSLSLSSLKT